MNIGFEHITKECKTIKDVKAMSDKVRELNLPKKEDENLQYNR